MKIVLIGYMGSGKSAVARALSAKLKLNLIDLDSYIEAQEGLSISQLFAEKGAVYFRNKERFYLQQLLDSEASMLVSLGGGTPLFFQGIWTSSKTAQLPSTYELQLPPFCKRLLPEKFKTAFDCRNRRRAPARIYRQTPFLREVLFTKEQAIQSRPTM